MPTLAGLSIVLAAVAADPAPLHHAIRVTVDPPAHRLAVDATLTWTEGAREPSLAELRRKFPEARIDKAGAGKLVVRYAGTIRDALEHPTEDYARGFATTTGTIEAEGVFLGRNAAWYPAASDPRLLTFELEVTLPAGWDAMSQGRRTILERTETGTRVRFVVDDPQEEIWLVAGPWFETRREAKNVEAIALLRSKDEALAAKYLDATSPNVAMYTELLGPHAYGKFALVENFWETGYGMPSFTLLGPAVMRLPFIPTTSYPHEILHDWWGNGVYVDRAKGNWCEGLTAYLADHMVQEQRGNAASYRQETLQSYADYVLRSKDFALASFQERHSAATQAVGYGKSLMVFHMIRRDIGDAAFTAALRDFYAEWKFKRASWDDLRRAFEKASGRDLESWFDRWVHATGAPALKIADVRAKPVGASWRLMGTLKQTHFGEPFPLSVPLAVTLTGRPTAHQEVARCTTKSCSFMLDLPAEPLRVDVDPEFDLFRALDRAETPPALSTAFGADGGVAVLPSAAPRELVEAYRAMLGGWSREDAKPLRVVTDKETAALPRDVPVWVIGWENTLVPEMSALVGAYEAGLTPAELRLPDERIVRSGHAVALVVRRADRPDLPIAFVAADTATQVPGLARKLPHYGKYSFLAFEGTEPTNTHKGRWPIVGSPLSVTLAGRTLRDVSLGSLAHRSPLAQLPPSFSEERMMALVRTLAAPQARGRGLGTPELDAAAETIASVMKGIGLEPAGNGGGYFQPWSEGDRSLRNVVGMIRGARPEWANEATVVSAHYDHLGEGHPGADDNASGVAVLLDLARAMVASGPPPRTVIFAAFTGEESGLLGSKRFLATWPKERTITSNVNLDTVGRLGGGELIVLGTGSADEWVHIANGAGYVTGVSVKAVASDPGGSDQKSFLEAGIPAVQLFTGAHADYHAATDTADRVDGPGLVKVASVAREFVGYLAERDRPLTARTGKASLTAAAAAPSGRKASLGAIPDYGFAGPGVRITGAMPGSPAEAAGLREGDVIVGMDDAKLASLAEFAAALGAKAPGDRVKVRVVRDGAEKVVEATLAAR